MALPIVIILGCIIVAVIIGLDIYFLTDSVSDNTWSEIIRKFGKRTPLAPFACGVLSGHFFWPELLKEFIPLLGQPGSVALLIWAACVVGIIGLGLVESGITFPLWLAFLIGTVGGVLLWPVGRWN
jgi:hypothetical protein